MYSHSGRAVAHEKPKSFPAANSRRPLCFRRLPEIRYSQALLGLGSPAAAAEESLGGITHRSHACWTSTVRTRLLRSGEACRVHRCCFVHQEEDSRLICIPVACWRG